MGDKLTLLRDGIPTEVFVVILVVSIAAIVSVFATALRKGPGNERSLRITIAVLCVLGLAIAGYVAYTAVILKEMPQCVGGGSGCSIVETSDYSKLFGIHVSIYGLIGYLAILGATFMRGDQARLIAFMLSLFGFGFSLYLTYLELWEILAICQWCVGSAVLMALIFIANTTRVVKYYGFGDEPEANAGLNQDQDVDS